MDRRRIVSNRTVVTEHSPRLPRLFTYAGILPFLILAAAHIYVVREGLWSLADLIPRALLLYAITIFSFLNGIRWGIAIVATPVRTTDIILSIIAFFAGWAVFLGSFVFVLDSHAGWGFIAFAVLFLIHYLWDRSAANEGHIPMWFLRQRFVASASAAISLAVSAVVLLAIAG